MTPPPVKVLAQAHGIPVYQPVTFKDGAATELLRTLAPELLVVVAYGRILPQTFLDVAKYGSINVHGSLLPKYRGAAPIQWAVLFDRLKTLGAELLVETVRKITSGDVVRVPQNEADATYTKMLHKEMCPIDWNKSPREIVKHICGLDPWPVATAELGGVSFRVFGAEYTDTKTALAPGKIVSAGKAGIEVACGGGQTLRITEIQAAGKKRMSAAAFLLGHPMKADG